MSTGVFLRIKDVKKKMIDLDLTMIELAKKSSVPYASLAHIFQSGNVASKSIAKLMNHFNCEFDEIFKIEV